jgi:competence protein ComEA
VSFRAIARNLNLTTAPTTELVLFLTSGSSYLLILFKRQPLSIFFFVEFCIFDTVFLLLVPTTMNKEPVKYWFGYTRRERRSSSILLGIIFMIIGFRYLVPESNMEIENFTSMLPDTASLQYNSGNAGGSVNELFAFDPNSASYDTLIRLGFAPGEANSMVRYRKMGGKFRRPSDLRKFQGVDSAMVAALEAYVVISPVASLSDDSHLPVREKPTLDINSCDSLSLVALPGIGPVLSARIIKYRTLLGGFARVEQLKEVYGLPPETYEKIKDRLYADSSAVRKVKINTAPYRELIRIPYIEKYDVSAILKYRELSGPIKSIEDLLGNKILTPEKAEKAAPYMDFM